MANKDYYEILGVPKSASQDEIKRAYRKLAAEHHPDRGGQAERFKEINEAYQILSDQQKRSQYDQFGTTFRQGGPGGPGGAGGYYGAGGFRPEDFGFDFNGGAAGVNFDFGDIFSTIFGGGAGPGDASRRTRGVDLEMPITISFEEAAFGAEKEVNIEKQNKCPRCEGSGAEPGSKIVTCSKCHGQGYIKTTRRTILGTMQSQTVCDQCNGTGKIPETPCKECGGSGVIRSQKKIKFNIPAGINEGQRIRIRGEGEAGYRGSENGDLYVIVHVLPSKEFIREGFDLHQTREISFPLAALGTTLEVKTLDGEVKMKIPAGTQSGKVFRIAGKGIQHLNRPGRGDMFVTVRVVTPTKLSRKQKDLLKELAETEE